jgi:serine-threonine kinase receptor-associated protein
MVRDGGTGDWIGTFTGHKGAVWSCRMDPSGSLAATASGDFSVQVWDGITGESLYQYPHKHIVKTCDFSPNSRYLATGGHEGILRVFDLTTPKKAPIEIAQDASKKIMISKINWLSDTLLLAGCGDGIVRFWEINAGGNVPKAPTHTIKTSDAGAEIRDMEVNSIKGILTIAAGVRVYFFNLQDHSLIHAYKMPINFTDEGGASLHPSGTKFVAGGSDLWVRVFDFATGEELECLKGHHGPIRCLRYAPDGKTYASGSEDGTIRLWKTEPDM